MMEADKILETPFNATFSTNKMITCAGIYCIKTTYGEVKMMCTTAQAFLCSYECSLPACQCNGHSRCVNGSVCEHCGNLTAGTHCQSCMPGYYGDPTNGGKCNGKCKGDGG